MKTLNIKYEPNSDRYLTQWDSRWTDVLIGTGKLTLGRWGCTTTCLSTVSKSFDCYQSPDQIAKNPKNYIDSEVNWIALDFPNFSFRWREGSLYSNAQNKIDFNLLKAWCNPLDPDKAIMFEVANRSHWVTGLWWNEYDNDFWAIDPATGKHCKVLETYGNITGAALFVRWNKNEHGGKQAWQGQPQAPIYA